MRKPNDTFDESILEFSKAEFYAYELILKKETKRYLENFDESASRLNNKDGVKHTSTFFGRDFTHVIHEWELKDGLEKCWMRIDEFDNFMEWSKFAKEYVKEFNLFLIEIPYLPYDLVIIKTILNEKKAIEVTDSNDQLNILASVNSFMKRFPGVINDLGFGDKSRPCYLKFEIDVDDAFIKNKVKKIKILQRNKELKNENQLKKYYEISQQLRIKHFDPGSSDYKMMTIFIKGKSLSILGFLEGLTNEFVYNNYEISFNPKNKVLMWAINTVFSNKIDYEFSNLAHFISISLFLTYSLRKLDDYEVNFDKLVSEYRKLDEKNSEEKKDLYHKLNDFDEQVFFIKSDLEQINFALKNPLNNSLNMIRNYNLISPKQYEKGYNFSNGMLEAIFRNNKNALKQICNKLSDLQKKGADFKNKFEKDIIFENTLSMNEHSKRNLWLSISMLVVSGIIAVQIIYNYLTLP